MPNANARRLRGNPTEAEKTLWRLLRNRRFQNWKFRRQHPIGPYIADFACLAARVIIEADGGQHADNARDGRRTEWLESEGWRVLRLWNSDILGNPEYVVTTIESALAPAPAPSPGPADAGPTSPAGGRGDPKTCT